jgi:hypothetical protein
MPTRRDFALTIGAATLGACVRAPAASPAPVLPAPVTTTTSPETDANAPLTDAMARLVRHRYGEHLSDEQMARVRSDIADGLRASDRLRAILVPNATGPDLVFSAFREIDR